MSTSSSYAAAPLAPAATFAQLPLLPALRATVAEMGLSEPTPIQAQAIPPLLAGRDVIGQARTGSGKTLAFGLPLVQRAEPALRAVQALVLVPTRELAIQVGGVLGTLAEARRLRLTLLYGGRSLLPEREALLRGAQLVVGTPGRTLDHLRQGNLSLRGLRCFVLDEGDEMLDRGFAPDVERILALAPAQRQTALFSATVPPWVAATAAKHLRNPLTIKVDAERETSVPEAVDHIVYDLDPAIRLPALRTLLDQRGDGPVLVFGRTKHGVKKLARQLAALGYPVDALQGNLSQNARERVMAAFRSGELPILLATNVAARGIDVDGIAQVINYELPDSPALFTHRAGRTGRMGRRGEVITFLTPDDAPKWREIERALGHRMPRRRWPQAEAAPAGAGAPLRGDGPTAGAQAPRRVAGTAPEAGRRAPAGPRGRANLGAGAASRPADRTGGGTKAPRSPLPFSANGGDATGDGWR